MVTLGPLPHLALTTALPLWCCRMVCERSMPSPPACALPALPSSPPPGHRAQRRRPACGGVFPGWTRHCTRKCPLCKWVVPAQAMPSTPAWGSALPHTPWEDRTGLSCCWREQALSLSKARPHAPSHMEVVLFSGFSSIQPVFMSTYLHQALFHTLIPIISLFLYISHYPFYGALTCYFIWSFNNPF